MCPALKKDINKVGFYVHKWEIFCQNVSKYLLLCFISSRNRVQVGKKDSSSTVLLIGAAAFAAWYFFSRANTLSSLVFNPVGVGVQGAAISLQLQVANPTPNAVQLNGFAGSLIISGSAVGNVTDFQPTLIPPGATNINLLVTPNVFGIAAGVIDLIDGNEGSGNFSAGLQGTANVNNIPVPVNLQFT